MADLASSDVTVTVNDRQIAGKKRRNRVTVVFGDGALFYPSGGVPLPTFSSFGMTRNIDFLTVFDADDASGIMWKYDRTNHKLRGYIQGADASGAGNGSAVHRASRQALASTGVGIAVQSSGAAGSGVLYQGTLVELAAGVQAPAAATLQAEAVGW